MKNIKAIFISFIALLTLTALFSCECKKESAVKMPVDYVNPYMGNISHLLVATFPTVHLPNSMLRVCPKREDYTTDQVDGLPVTLVSHRGISAFRISPVNNIMEDSLYKKKYSYDNEIVKPYFYSVLLDDEDINVSFAPAHQSAVYSMIFNQGKGNLVLMTATGQLEATDAGVQGYENIGKDSTRVYIYLETEQKPTSIGMLSGNQQVNDAKIVKGKDVSVVLSFADSKINVRYGISFISVEQAKKNLKKEINTYNVDEIAKAGREIWNKTLGKVTVEGDDQDAKIVFYTSLYRTYERMINISEDGKYYSGFDHKVHEDGGTPFFTDDWIWDTYRAVHPLRVILEPEMEQQMINSFLLMAKQSKEGWLPTFPVIDGDNHCMNGNHGFATIWDAYSKGLHGFDLNAAYEAGKKTLTQKSLIPWSRTYNTELDSFYIAKGFYPALNAGEKEHIKEVNGFEKREAVAITLAACFDDWSFSKIAKELGKTEDFNYFNNRSKNYHNIYNSETAFFHPRNKDGEFIQPFDYRFSGGYGCRDYYDENDGWVYRWDVQSNIQDLINLMGGNQNFVNNLDQTFREPLGRDKPNFYAQNADHTGNVGQFSMGNEPALHIPYLYNYAGQPWKTQKRVRVLMQEWFRNDLMGIPGDEDGGGMSAFVVFSSLGFYPVTPGLPMYVIGSPVFKEAKIQLANGKTFEVFCLNYSPENKYIQSAKLNGKEWNKSWFSHADLMNGGKLEFVMGKLSNKNWASSADAVPPSYEMQK